MTHRLLLAFFFALQSAVALASGPARTVDIGLYQSAPEPIPKDIQPQKGVKELRTFLQIFPDNELALFRSDASASKVIEKEQGRQIHMEGGGTTYKAVENRIIFWHGPTKHTVTVIDKLTLDLQSKYTNGNVFNRRLYRVPQPE